MTGLCRRLTVTQEARVDGARALLAADATDLSAGYDVIDPANLAQVNGYAYGAARGAVAELLDIIGALAVPGVTLTPAQLAIVLGALADAETYREREGSTPCLGCIDAPPSVGLCAEHSADFDAAQAYHDLTAELTGGVS